MKKSYWLACRANDIDNKFDEHLSARGLSLQRREARERDTPRNPPQDAQTQFREDAVRGRTPQQSYGALENFLSAHLMS